MEVIGRGDLSVVFRCGGGVLLIFDPRKSGEPGRDVPSHGTSGAGHIAFGAKPEDLDAWRQQLRKAGVSIEREVDWDEGGRSIYFRDPAGNVVELAPPTIWGGGSSSASRFTLVGPACLSSVSLDRIASRNE
ncbi:MAG: glyoxalase/bleomycin resistance/extradiol dioxygenase family protein [Verrucomicrobia bacterium]|nr:MAG: glyoxalase/bleomycin resistance/extradiol dioxygenase family protein [Verrucomicrobiota bacterium]